jgi:hypothetical protein
VVNRRAALLFSSLCLAFCVSGRSQQTHEAALPSGRKIKIIAEGQVQSTVDGSIIGLMLKYQTDFKITDTANLRKEVDEIWVVFKPDVERLRLKSGIISANEVPDGGMGKGFNFVFQKQDDGSWLCLGDQRKSDPAKKQKK